MKSIRFPPIFLNLYSSHSLSFLLFFGLSSLFSLLPSFAYLCSIFSACFSLLLFSFVSPLSSFYSSSLLSCIPLSRFLSFRSSLPSSLPRSLLLPLSCFPSLPLPLSLSPSSLLLSLCLSLSPSPSGSLFLCLSSSSSLPLSLFFSRSLFLSFSLPLSLLLSLSLKHLVVHRLPPGETRKSSMTITVVYNPLTARISRLPPRALQSSLRDSQCVHVFGNFLP